MMLFMLVAVLIAFALVVAGAQRPRPSLFVAAAMWLAYAVWEYYIATGVLCDKDCNIRVDLVFFFPILAIATWHAYQSYQEPSREMMIRGMILGAVGIVLVALGLWAFGYNVYAMVAGVCAMALAGYAVRMKFAGKAEVAEG